MKTPVKVLYSFALLFLVTVLFSSFREKPAFPYQKAGLTERQAAAHLLSRFTYGSKDGDVDAVVKMGLEKWFRQQLDGDLSDDSLNLMLSRFDDINLSNTEVENKYPRPNRVLKLAIADGSIHKDSVDKGDRKAYREQIRSYMEKKGFKPEQELYRQFINQKILRAAYSRNQLRELLTDFWFNHFNVSLTKNQCASFIPAYERDVIRPNVAGKFEHLLLATAKSPAMLVYLDNFTSTGQPVVLENNGEPQMNGAGKPVKRRVPPKRKQGGLNENYAREVMELHTLGVDGGYTQSDVTQAARVLTGWTLAPMGEEGYGAAMQKIIDNVGAENLKKRGFVREGDFLFVPNRHDNEEKTVLGKHFAAGGGYDEGLTLLNMLARHPSTAQFISKKIATRFVNDNPAQTLIDKMAKTFTKTDGDIRQVMMTMVSSAEFWSPASLREKTKSPFELAISAVRSLDADITQPYQLFNWINKMGQKMYYYQAPTGFPDKGQYWINTGALLNRMNFGLALAAQRIPGVKINLSALNNHHEPESAEAALLTYSKMIMPERNLTETVKRLKPMLNDPSLSTKVANAADKNAAQQEQTMMGENSVPLKTAANNAANNNAMLAQVVGVIIGSPEFQRK
ncbi:Uncharacterized conserved protein, DUF1800 family [Pedobacter steynii]|uniref:Uncharacterized conserved protein, DUF1800 family n=1 Tax=Pedobacter steynii TaxID=430522 RepID=A0A1H0FML7_9SPHI|nr:DUF1800 domain-containing protein [Pedobacter steynii]NQX42059.1 DUF1800 domain-containing protein [Pedobacter steynii]SDN95903.1 Uncharacterized conserved protein, DUF1800 family [Pedobacter steynii]